MSEITRPSTRPVGAARRFRIARAGLSERERVALGDLQPEASAILRTLAHLGDAPVFVRTSLVAALPELQEAATRLRCPHVLAQERVGAVVDSLVAVDLLHRDGDGVWVADRVATYERAAAVAGGQGWWSALALRVVERWVGGTADATTLVHALSVLQAPTEALEREDVARGCRIYLWAASVVSMATVELPLEALEIDVVGPAWRELAEAHDLAEAREVSAATVRSERAVDSVRVPRIQMAPPTPPLGPGALLLVWMAVMLALWFWLG